MSPAPRTGRRIFAVGALIVAVTLATQALAESDAEARGNALVIRYCGMCHAVGIAGESPNALAPPFRRLHERYRMDNLARALTEGLLVGHPAMPELRFSPREVLDIIAYLKSIQTKAHAQAGQRPPIL